MSIFSRKESYIKQISLYLSNAENELAFELSKEFRKRFPKNMISNYFLAKTEFRLGKYQNALEHARAAFNLSKGVDDLSRCGTLLGTIHYLRKDYESGEKIMGLMPDSDEPAVLELRFLFSVAHGKSEKAAHYIERLYKIHPNKARKAVLAAVSGKKQDE